MSSFVHVLGLRTWHPYSPEKCVFRGEMGKGARANFFVASPYVGCNESVFLHNPLESRRSLQEDLPDRSTSAVRHLFADHKHKLVAINLKEGRVNRRLQRTRRTNQIDRGGARLGVKLVRPLLVVAGPVVPDGLPSEKNSTPLPSAMKT